MRKARPTALSGMQRLALRMSCAAVALLVLAGPWSVHAQDSDSLRGEVPEDAIADELLRLQKQRDFGSGTARAKAPGEKAAQAAANRTPQPAYAPFSAGATPDDDKPSGPEAAASGSLFESLNPDDVQPAEGAAKPSSARERAKQARERMLPPDKRRQAEKAAMKKKKTAAADAPEDGRDDDLSTASLRADRETDGEEREKLDPGSEREAAIEAPSRKRAEDDPYAPLGLRLGSFNLYSTLEQGLVWTSNVNSSPDAEAALQSETTLRLRAQSDWSEHEARIEAYGTLRRTLDGPKLDDDSAGLSSALRYDITNDLRARGTFDYEISPESATSAVVIEGAVSRPIRQTIDATAGLEKDLGKLRLSAVAGISNDRYGDATLDTGEKLSQRERDSTLYNLRLRTGYEISPALTPFAEVEVGRREYETKVDAAGYRRSADRLAARAGLGLDLGEKLRGEVAAGWLQEKPDDRRLEVISGPALDANLVWSPGRGTDVTLYGSTTVDGTTTPGESGSLLYTLRGSVDRRIRADLTASALLGLSWRDYMGSTEHDLTLTGEASLTWWLNRYVGLTGRYRHEQLFSNADGRDYKTDSVMLGMKLQR